VIVPATAARYYTITITINAMSVVGSLLGTVGAVVLCGFLFKLVNIMAKLFFASPTNVLYYTIHFHLKPNRV